MTLSCDLIQKMQVKGGLNASETNEATAPREQATLEKEEKYKFLYGGFDRVWKK